MPLRDQKGFSLIELAVVVLIGGLILGFTMPQVNKWLVQARTRDAASRIAGEMRLARQKAVSNNSRAWFYTVNGYNYYWTGEERWQGGTSYAPIQWKGPIYLPSSVRLVNPNWGGLNYFYYKPDGRPLYSGSVRVVGVQGTPDTIAVNVDLSGTVWQ